MANFFKLFTLALSLLYLDQLLVVLETSDMRLFISLYLLNLRISESYHGLSLGRIVTTYDEKCTLTTHCYIQYVHVLELMVRLIITYQDHLYQYKQEVQWTGFKLAHMGDFVFKGIHSFDRELLLKRLDKSRLIYITNIPHYNLLFRQ